MFIRTGVLCHSKRIVEDPNRTQASWVRGERGCNYWIRIDWTFDMGHLEGLPKSTGEGTHKASVRSSTAEQVNVMRDVHRSSAEASGGHLLSHSESVLDHAAKAKGERQKVATTASMAKKRRASATFVSPVVLPLRAHEA